LEHEVPNPVNVTDLILEALLNAEEVSFTADKLSNVTFSILELLKIFRKSFTPLKFVRFSVGIPLLANMLATLDKDVPLFILHSVRFLVVLNMFCALTNAGIFSFTDINAVQLLNIESAMVTEARSGI
jgi:hypothetical protein